MLFEDLMDKRVVSCLPETTVDKVVDLMREKGVGAILITESDKPIGIITDRNIAIRCVGRNLSPETTMARDVMTTELETISAEASLGEVFERMKTATVRRLPVVDDYGKVVGLVSSDDAFDWVSRELTELSEKLSALVGACDLRKTKLFHKAA